MQAASRDATSFTVLESVLCLECAEIYSKPVAGGTVEKNPGCPHCGYVGWIPLSPPEQAAQHHPAGGQRRHRLARPH